RPGGRPGAVHRRAAGRREAARARGGLISVRDALDSALVALRAARVDTPRLDAEVLLADVLGVSREDLVVRDLVVEGPAVRRFQDAVRRRAVDREPVGDPHAQEITHPAPHEALFAGGDGLSALRALVPRLRAAWVALEHGAAQGEAVRGLLRDAGYDTVATHRDLAGHERVTTGADRR